MNAATYRTDLPLLSKAAGATRYLMAGGGLSEQGVIHVSEPL